MKWTAKEKLVFGVLTHLKWRLLEAAESAARIPVGVFSLLIRDKIQAELTVSP